MTTPLGGQVRVIHQYPYLLQALLFDFEVNKAELRAFHRHWLSRHATPLRLSGQAVKVHGFASPAGPEALNLSLSARRAAGVTLYLRDLAPFNAMTVATTSNGEQPARQAGLPDGTEDETWRGVLLTMVDLKALPKPPPPPPRPRKVQRAVSVSLMVDEEIKGLGSSDPGWRAAKLGMNLARAAFDLGQGEPVLADIDETWVVASITLKKTDHKGDAGVTRVTLTEMVVTFEWKAAAPERIFIDGKKSWPIDADVARKWLDEPMKSFMRYKYLTGAP